MLMENRSYTSLVDPEGEAFHRTYPAISRVPGPVRLTLLGDPTAPAFYCSPSQIQTAVIAVAQWGADHCGVSSVRVEFLGG